MGLGAKRAFILMKHSSKYTRFTLFVINRLTVDKANSLRSKIIIEEIKAMKGEIKCVDIFI